MRVGLEARQGPVDALDAALASQDRQRLEQAKAHGLAGDILDYSDFFLPAGQLPYDDKAFEKRLRKPPEAAGLLTRFRDRLAAAESFDAPALDELMQDFVQSEGIKIGQVIHAVRVAVTGKAVGFGLFETLAILGRECCIERIDRALARL